MQKAKPTNHIPAMEGGVLLQIKKQPIPITAKHKHKQAHDFKSSHAGGEEEEEEDDDDEKTPLTAVLPPSFASRLPYPRSR